MESEQVILQKRMSQFLVNEVFNTISDDDIFRLNSSGKWTHKGNELTQGQVDVIKKEAKNIANIKTYNILMDEVRYHAREALNKAVTEQDIITAKLLSYFVDVIKSKLKKLSEL